MSVDQLVAHIEVGHERLIRCEVWRYRCGHCADVCEVRTEWITEPTEIAAAFRTFHATCPPPLSVRRTGSGRRPLPREHGSVRGWRQHHRRGESQCLACRPFGPKRIRRTITPDLTPPPGTGEGESRG